MNSIPLFESLKSFVNILVTWRWLLILIIIAVLPRILKNKKITAKIRGFIGEKRVSAGLKSLPKNEYHLLNNVLLSSDSGTSQVDHIIVSVYGIFVIETKNYQGIIYGSEKSSMWTQNIYGNKKEFKNPIHQNYGHIKTIQAHLPEFPDVPIKSVIAFSDNSTLKVSTSTNVVNFSQVLTCIKAMSADKVLSVEDMEKIVKKLSGDNIEKSGQRKAHNMQANAAKVNTERCISDRICPKCGGELVVRQGKNGQFLGCSNYPRCHFTSNIR